MEEGGESTRTLLRVCGEGWRDETGPGKRERERPTDLSAVNGEFACFNVQCVRVSECVCVCVCVCVYVCVCVCE